MAEERNKRASNLVAALIVVEEQGFTFHRPQCCPQMKCSTQPIYLEFTNMDGLREQCSIAFMIISVMKFFPSR